MNYKIAMRSAFSRSSAFSRESTGGNPAGILVCNTTLPTRKQMLAIAAQVGAAETVFASPIDSQLKPKHWQVRYFSPEQEVPFCGHATVALAAELFARFGQTEFKFSLSHQDISVYFTQEKFAIIQSPKPCNHYVDAKLQQQIMTLFNLSDDDLLTPRIALVNAGSNHLALELKSRATLAGMDYQFEATRELMQRLQIATVALYYRHTPFKIDIRNAFAFGGLYEDPATGSGAAAVAGYLYATCEEYQPGDSIEFSQGDDMGQPCTLLTELPDKPGESIKLIGESRPLPDKLVPLN